MSPQPAPRKTRMSPSPTTLQPQRNIPAIGGYTASRKYIFYFCNHTHIRNISIGNPQWATHRDWPGISRVLSQLSYATLYLICVFQGSQLNKRVYLEFYFQHIHIVLKTKRLKKTFTGHGNQCWFVLGILLLLLLLLTISIHLL